MSKTHEGSMESSEIDSGCDDEQLFHEHSSNTTDEEDIEFAVDTLRTINEDLSLHDVQNLQAISLSGLNLASLPLDIRLYSSLVSLDISYNNIQHLESEIIVLYLPNLKKLDVSHNKIRDFSCIQRLGHLQYLQELNVQGNPLPAAAHRPVLLQKLLFADLSGDIVQETTQQREAWLNCIGELGLGIGETPDEDGEAVIMGESFAELDDSTTGTDVVSIKIEHRIHIPQLMLGRPSSAPVRRKNSSRSIEFSHQQSAHNASKSSVLNSSSTRPRPPATDCPVTSLSERPRSLPRTSSRHDLKRSQSSMDQLKLSRQQSQSHVVIENQLAGRRGEISHPESPSTLSMSRHNNVHQLRRTKSSARLLPSHPGTPSSARRGSQTERAPTRKFRIAEWSQVPLEKHLEQKEVKRVLREREKERLFKKRRPIYVDMSKGVPPPNSEYRFITHEEIEQRMRHFYRSFVPSDMRPFRESLEVLNVSPRTKTYAERLKPLQVPRKEASAFPMLNVVNGQVVTILEFLTAENEEIFDICIGRSMARDDDDEESDDDDNNDESTMLNEQSRRIFYAMDTFAEEQLIEEQQGMLRERGTEPQCNNNGRRFSAKHRPNPAASDHAGGERSVTQRQHHIGEIVLNFNTVDHMRHKFRNDSRIVEMIDRSTKDEFVEFEDYKTLKNQRKWERILEKMPRSLDVDFTNVIRWELRQRRKATDRILGTKNRSSKDFRPLKEQFLEMDKDEIELKMTRMELQQKIEDMRAIARSDRMAAWKRAAEQQRTKVPDESLVDMESEFRKAHPDDPVSKSVSEMRQRLDALFSRQWTHEDEYSKAARQISGDRSRLQRRRGSISTSATPGTPKSRLSDLSFGIPRPKLQAQSQIPRVSRRFRFTQTSPTPSTSSQSSVSSPASIIERRKNERTSKQAAKIRRLSQATISLNGVQFKYSSLFV